MDWIGVIAITLTLVAGLNAPLAMSALSLAAVSGQVLLRPEFGWVGTPWFLGAALLALLLQIYIDLYFVPITVKDRVYLNPRRTHNAYLSARVQSFFRPLVAALAVAALPLPLADWTAAVGGFTGATACYWLSAWIRECVATTRGAIILFILETLKNAILIPVAMLLFWLPFLMLGVLIAALLPTILWTMRLQRERAGYIVHGGQRVREDA